MRQKHMTVLVCLMLVGLLSAACGGSGNPTPNEPDRVATRVAEAIAVAATLTALAPTGDQPAVPAVTSNATGEATSPTEAAAPPAASCRVISAGLNLRPGPGTVYAPPLAALARDTELRPVSFVARGFPTGQWIEAQVVSSGRVGWVSAEPTFVACNLQLATLPAGTPPPTPTPAPTATSLPPTDIPIIPPATPPPPAQVAVIPVDGSDGNQALGNDRGVNSGRNLLLPGFAPYEVSDPMVFHDRLVFQVEVFDRNVGKNDGAGIESVTFTIRDETGSTVHERTERAPGYCVFGGGEPDCTVWRFSEHGNRWPGGADLQPGVHDAQIVITPKHGDAVSWFWSFRVEE